MQSGNSTSETANYLALGWTEHYEALPPWAAAQLEQLRASLNKLWVASDESGKPRLRKAAACLDRLSACCLQVSRMAAHARTLERRPLPANAARIAREQTAVGFERGMVIVRTFDEACVDFESLLFHSRAALDVLTRFVAAEHGQVNELFSKLRNILTNVGQDARAATLLRVLDEAQALKGVLTDPEDAPVGKSLRSLVAHYTSLQVEIKGAFTVTRLPNGRLLIFDCSALGHPVLATARRLAQDVPFVVLSAVATYLGEPSPLNRSGCQPTWRNPTVVFDDFIDEMRRGPIFDVAAAIPDGFTYRREHLKPDVLRFAVAFEDRRPARKSRHK